MSAPIDEILLRFSYDIGLYGLMNSRNVWPVVESLHFFGLCLLIGSVGIFDLRMLGIGRGISFAALHKLIPFGLVGYGINAITGFMFVLAAPGQYLYNPAFQTKLLFMLCAGINMLTYYATVNQRLKQTPDFDKAMVRAKIIAIISLVCWMGVISCGRLITFFRPPYHWCFWC